MPINSPAYAARAVYEGVPGHPVLTQARALRGFTQSCPVTSGARVVLEQVRVGPLEAAHLCSNADVDTPEQLEAMAR